MSLDELKKIYSSVIQIIRNEEKDLTDRQKGILLTVYLNDELQTIRSLSKHLDISKAAVSRAVNTMEKYGFLRRMPDHKDKRSVIINRTVQGSVYIDNWNEILKNSQED